MRFALPFLSMVLLLATFGPLPASAEANTSFEMHTDVPLGEAGVLLRVDAPSGATCDLQGSGAGGGARHRAGVAFLEAPGAFAWVGSSGGSIVRAHAGPVDTDAVIPGGHGYWEVGIGMEGFTFTGTLLLGFAGEDMRPWPTEVRDDWPFEGEAPGNHTVSLSLACDGIVTWSLSGGTDAITLNARSAEGGAGAYGAIVGGLNVRDVAEASYSANEVLFAMGSFGVQAGTVALESPDSTQTWVLSPTAEPLVLSTGDAGDYRVTLDRAGIHLEAFWAVAFGLHPVDDLGEIATLPP